MEKIICYVAGVTQGNPGAATVGVCIVTESGEMIKDVQQSIGNATSHFAEYNAVMVGMQTLAELYGDATKMRQFDIYLSNRLVKQQLNAEKPITEPGLVPMFIEIHNMRVVHFPQLTLTDIPKEENKADTKFTDEILDGK